MFLRVLRAVAVCGRMSDEDEHLLMKWACDGGEQV